MIELIATAESTQQAERLLSVGVDTLYIGEETYGLRLPKSFSREEQRQIVTLAHQMGKKVIVAVNAIMHPDKMKTVPAYLHFLAEIGVDQISVGDPGVIYLLQKDPFLFSYIYDGETLVTSSRQINFWAKRGAVGAVLAREVPFDEMVEIAKSLQVPAEVLVYGATCIHQSKRPLLHNYYQYTENKESADKDRGLFLSEPKKEETHYSIYEDSHGTHIFADNDISLMMELPKLLENNYVKWKLDGIYTPGDAFVEIAKLFDDARKKLLDKTWSNAIAGQLSDRVKQNHPKKRGLDNGFFDLNPDDIK